MPPRIEIQPEDFGRGLPDPLPAGVSPGIIRMESLLADPERRGWNFMDSTVAQFEGPGMTKIGQERSIAKRAGVLMERAGKSNRKLTGSTKTRNGEHACLGGV